MLNTTEGISQRFQHYVLLNPKCFSHWHKNEKIEDQVNQILSFYQGDLDLIKCYKKEVFGSLKRRKSSYDQPIASLD